VTRTTLSAADAALLAKQASEVSACLDTYIPSDRPVALLKFPLDDNVGNHMMWLSICDYLKSRGIRIAYTAHEWDFNVNDLVKAIGDGPILFLGGVTVSRLWPDHAKVKRAVADACPGNRLISLPSTMLFVDDDDRREASTIFGDHRDVVMMARDPASAASAREIFPAHTKVVTIHDSTFMLSPQPRATVSAEHDVIWLARADKESAGYTVPDDVKVFDWTPWDRNRVYVKAGRIGSKLGRSAPMLLPMTTAVVSASYRAISQQLISHGNDVLDQGRVLVSDRMHPHILAALRSQHCVLLPDQFGKNRAVWEYSTRGYSTIHWADEPAQALDIARALAAAPEAV
jgi:exopolysaccharide biosynthesis predicted pyruvyltransferase EpsI